MNHVVMFSSGAGSWAAAKRVAERHGTEDLTLLFADVRGQNPSPHAGEDEDNYRFLYEAAANVGGRLVVLNEGRDIWQVYFDEHMLGNSRVAPCSKRLKQIPARRWLEENCEPGSAVVYVGIDWTEEHRLPKIQSSYQPFRCEAPLTEAPYMEKQAALDLLRAEGIEPPRLYGMGFAHANCGAFCCRMGMAQAELLLRRFPERYAYHEAKEQEFRDSFGWDVSFLRDRRGGEVTPLTLRAFRQRLEVQPSLFDADEWGGCGCFTDTEGDAA